MTSAPDLITAAALGAVGSLAVQWLFGGHVAAHHERVKELYRYRRELKDRLFAVGVAAARLDHEPLAHDIPDKIRQALIAEELRAYDIIDKATAEMIDQVAEGAGTYRWKFREAVEEYVVLARGVVLSQRTQQEKAQILRECSTLMIRILFGSKIRWVPRMRELRSADDTFAEYRVS
jgi:hypothetical protein